MLATGWGFTAIARALPEEAHLSARNVREHLIRSHLPVDAAIARKLVEASGGSHAAVFEMGIERALIRLVGSAVAVQHYHHHLNAGLMRPTLANALRVCKRLAVLEDAVKDDDRLHLIELLEHREESIRSLLGVLKHRVPESEWSDLLRMMDRDDVLRVWVPEAALAERLCTGLMSEAGP